MQAIQTKYYGPTNTRGSRFKATCAAHSVTVGYDYSLNIDDNHKAACKALQEAMAKRGGDHWLKPMVSGCLKDGTYAHVFAGV